MKMDFEKETREIAESFELPFTDEFIEGKISGALRRAFIAGQEDMRGRSAHFIHSNVIALSRMAVSAKKSGLADEQDLMETQCVFAQELESSIRSLPLLEEPNKEVAG